MDPRVERVRCWSGHRSELANGKVLSGVITRKIRIPDAAFEDILADPVSVAAPASGPDSAIPEPQPSYSPPAGGGGNLPGGVARRGVCARCGRPLTSEQSIAAGLGPVCATKV